MNTLHLTKLKTELDSFRPFNKDILENLSQWFEVELTYSSNAIEGNTLSRKETALVIEKGLTVGGKPLKDHIEATNHKEALIAMKNIIDQKEITLSDILFLHQLILKGIDDVHAGKIRTVPVRISGSPVILPNHQKVHHLLDQLIHDINKTEKHPVLLAADAHYKFVSIHPFVDGNGRTGRLLMNLILMKHGYPPAIITPKERLAYIQALEQGQLGGTLTDYYTLIEKAVSKSLHIYLKAFKGKPEQTQNNHDLQLLKIGELSKETHEPLPTLRYWTKIGLLNVSTTTPSGYQLYSKSQIALCKRIRALQKQRYTLDEIYKKIHQE